MTSTLHDAPARPASFDELGLPGTFVQLLRRRGITEPLPIQAMTMVDALAGRDVAGGAPTGSGKTLAFSLPMAATLPKGRPHRPTGLVLAPTRELAAQIAAELAPFARLRGLRVHPFYGGVGYGPQLKAMQQGVDVVVACPGRLEDLMGGRHVVLDDVRMVVVDEADRMADMGFLPAVRRILDATRADRQTLLFSATLDGDVDVLVRKYQRQPVRHDVRPVEDGSTVTHRFHYVAHDERVAACARVIAEHGSTIVFVRTRHGADRLVKQLGRTGVGAVPLHGDRSQAQRERALASFSSGSARALVATDVAARGIHVDDVACVVHFDLPADAKDYVHRSGRTARAGNDGVVVALVSPEHHKAADDLRRGLDVAVLLDGDAPASATRPAASAPPRRSGTSSPRGRSGRRRSGAPAGRSAH